MERKRPQARQATKEELRRHLSSASADWARDALDNPELGASELVLLLRNRDLLPETLERIAGDRRWTGHHQVRRGVVGHGRAPVTAARNLLPHLYWKDWLELSIDPATNPLIRRQAEKMLLGKLSELGLGERIALARRCSRALLPALIAAPEPRVVEALLANPRLTEVDLVTLCRQPETTGEALELVALHTVWGRRRNLRLELLQRAEIPVATLLRLAHAIDQSDLHPLLDNDKVPPIVRVAIERRLDGDRESTG